MKIRAYPFLALAGLTALTVLGLGDAGPAQAEVKPRFVRVRCPRDPFIQLRECGYVSVPENRSRKTGRSIRLFVMRERRRGPDIQPEPVFYLTGGPGEKAAPSTDQKDRFADRDFVIFDQRGIGYSKPALECPEITRINRGTESIEAFGERKYQLLKSCGQRYRQSGIDLGAYNATESAADIEAVRQALGYKKINLVGVSYGTRLAQEYMRGYSAHLRAVVLDSVLPASVDRAAEMPRSAEAALQETFKACNEDETCSQNYPDVSMRYLELVRHLDEAGGDVDEGTAPMLVEDLLNYSFRALYRPHDLGNLPRLFYQLHNGEMKARVKYINTTGSRDGRTDLSRIVSWGAFYAVECRGEIAFSSAEALAQTYAELPHWQRTMAIMPDIASPRMRDLCRDWGLTEPSGRENEPVSSNVPTLLMSGRFDPVTPPRFLPIASQKLKQAYSFTLPLSHSLLRTSSCAAGLALDFIFDPSQEPYNECLDFETFEWFTHRPAALRSG